jgi:hypothetical protein
LKGTGFKAPGIFSAAERAKAEALAYLESKSNGKSSNGKG